MEKVVGVLEDSMYSNASILWYNESDDYEEDRQDYIEEVCDKVVSSVPVTFELQPGFMNARREVIKEFRFRLENENRFNNEIKHTPCPRDKTSHECDEDCHKMKISRDLNRLIASNKIQFDISKWIKTFSIGKESKEDFISNVFKKCFGDDFCYDVLITPPNEDYMQSLIPQTENVAITISALSFLNKFDLMLSQIKK